MPTPSSRSFWVPSLAIPAVRAVRKEDDRRSYSLPPASTDHDSAHHWSDAFSASRMRTLLGPSRASKSLHRTVSISDTLMSARRHARVGLRTARCAIQNTLLADGVLNLTYEPKDPLPPCR
jgi:hypothetical protein